MNICPILHRLHVFVIAIVSSCGCTERNAPQEIEPSNSVPRGLPTAQRVLSPPAMTTNPPPSKPRDEAIPCKVDSDCPVLACGPCEPGKVITKALMDGPDCHKNPCKNSHPYCNLNGVCAIHPKTVPAVP